jgi:dTDP-4-dehydrorhamnose 3,5-epimerase
MDRQNLITNIDGVICSPLRQHSDEHGSVLHMLRADDPEFINFGECYFSEILPDAIKAWKFHQKQTQNITVPIGKIRLVIFDDRGNSSTWGNVGIIVLDRYENYCRVKIPPNLWYGFACLTNTPALIVNCADIPHDPAESQRKEISDADIPYTW